MNNGDWTPERVALLRELWAQKLTGSEIAAQLGGLTRNAVIGKANRLNLPRRPVGGAARRAPRPEPKSVRIVALAMEGVPPKIIAERVGSNNRVVSVALSKARAAGVAIPYVLPSAKKRRKNTGGGIANNLRRRAGKAFAKPKRVPQRQAPMNEPVSLGIPFANLAYRGQCKFPHGDGPFLACGHPTFDGGVYCEFHHRLCYEPIDHRRQKVTHDYYLRRVA